MKRRWLLILLLCTLTSVARADDTTKHAKVEKLLDIMHLDRMVSTTVDVVSTQMKSQLDLSRMTPAQQETSKQFMDQVLSLVKANITWQKMKPDFVEVYSKTFSEEEIDAMYSFYSTPVGQAVLEKALALQQSMQSMQSVNQELLQKIKPLSDEYEKKMREEAAAPAPSPAPSK